MAKKRKPKGHPAHRPGALSAFWHGGAPGLVAGDRLLPRVSQRALSTYEAAQVPYDPERVYVTTDRQLARAFAASLGGGRAGSLYNVRPEEPLVPDPDYPFVPPPSFMTASAVVVRVVEPEVRMTEAEEVRATARWTTWPDGSPAYDMRGFLTLFSEWEQAGVTEERLRECGPWRHMMAVAAELNEEFSAGFES